jgi:NAD-dependent SIR2 family protein deacetylase
MSSAIELSMLKLNVARQTSDTTAHLIDRVAELILECDAILFTSGAGMGVRSGFGTFRGLGASVWPPLRKEPEIDYIDIADPKWFRKLQGNSSKHDTANFAYAFWSDLYNTYSSTPFHIGYSICKRWSELSHMKFVFSFTSNIDGHWIKSGWNDSSVLECHGSVDYMQCVDNCCKHIWVTKDQLKLTIDPDTDCVIDSLPICSGCNQLARPNVMMFSDWEFSGDRCNEKFGLYAKFQKDVATVKARLLIIELGAGITVPTVRMESERLFTDKRWAAHLVRINAAPENSIIDLEHRSRSDGEAIELSLDALTALTLIDIAIKTKDRKTKN